MIKKMIKKNTGFTPTPILALLRSFFSDFLNKLKNMKEFCDHGVLESQQKTMPKLVSGFTLIESLVAISVLLISIAGPISLAQQSMSSARLTKNQIVAFYLAQDAIEFIRSKRDSNILASEGDPTVWLSGLGDCLLGECLVDVPTGTLSTCGTECSLIRKDDDPLNGSGLYGYDSGWTETGFRRNVTMTALTSGGVPSKEVYVKVEIFWDDDTKSFVARELLFNLLD